MAAASACKQNGDGSGGVCFGPRRRAGRRGLLSPTKAKNSEREKGWKERTTRAGARGGGGAAARPPPHSRAGTRKKAQEARKRCSNGLGAIERGVPCGPGRLARAVPSTEAAGGVQQPGGRGAWPRWGSRIAGWERGATAFNTERIRHGRGRGGVGRCGKATRANSKVGTVVRPQAVGGQEGHGAWRRRGCCKRRRCT